MKVKIFLSAGIILFLFSHISFAQAPKQVAGLTLGGNISEYKDKVLMESAIPIRYQEYLSEVEIKETELFTSGLITYATCDDPGRIVRIKLKYADSSKKFYEQLLQHFKKRFGEPDEWRGDPFHVVIAWKWSFIDSTNNHISMILQHNTMDEEEKMGNALKMTLTDLIIKERRCHEKKHPQKEKSREKPRKQKKGKRMTDWDLLIPR